MHDNLLCPSHALISGLLQIYPEKSNSFFFFVFFTLAQLVAISSISTTQLLTPGSGGTEIAGKASEPHLGGGSAHFRYFHPLWSDASSGRGPRATMGGVMIRFAVSECAPYSGCLSGNLLDYFHLIGLRTLGPGRRGSPEARCFLRSGRVCSFMCFVGVWDAHGGGRGRRN